MQKKFMIGVDLGTSGTKAALYQVDGKLVSASFGGSASLLSKARCSGARK